MESGRFGAITGIGCHEGMSGTRVSQLLSLLDLRPDILAAIDAAGDDEQATGIGGTVTACRRR